MKIILEKEQQLYFTSDTHYNHRNICRGVSEWKDKNNNIPVNQTRDFKTLDHMNSVIVDNINSNVGENDILVHMGDFSFGGFESIIEFRKRIVCKNIVLFCGNHDKFLRENKDGVQGYFKHVSDYALLDVRRPIEMKKGGMVERLSFVCFHHPIASWDSMNRGVPHLFGHVHLGPTNKIMKNSKSMDVGCDGNDLKPYSLNEINKIMKNQPIGKLVLPADHHMEEVR